MENFHNFHNDCCHPRTKNPFKNSCSRQLRIVNAVVTFGFPAGGIYLPKPVFLQTKATHFETMMITVEEVNSDKTKVPHEFIIRSVLLDCFIAELDE